MDTLKEFLEVTSIHGLYHISKTKSLRRIFWTLTSTTGFLLSFSMIYESFQNFSKTPISTTIETFPISKVPFPLITVCPVKNTLTNLNYDLVNFQNYHLSRDERNDLVQLFYESLQEVDFKITIEYMKEVTQRHWLIDIYKKLTTVNLLTKPELVGEEAQLYIKIDTFITSGQIKTPFYRKEIFNPTKFPLYISFNLFIYIPKSLKGTNATIGFNINNDIEAGPEHVRVHYQEIGTGNKFYNKTLDVRNCYTNCNINFKRSFSKEAFVKCKNKRFTGMDVNWNFNGENIRPEDQFDNDFNNIFCKIVNMIRKERNNEKLWNNIRMKRRLITDDFFYSTKSTGTKFIDLFDLVFPLYANISTEPIDLQNIEENDLVTALEMLVYLFNDPQDIWKNWKIFYENLFETGSERLIVSTLSGILSASYDQYSKEVAGSLLESVSQTLGLKYNLVTNMSSNHLDGFSRIISNHPVHILDDLGNMSPSAFIPFCQFGDTEMQEFGEDVVEFDIPVCQIFKMTVLKDQLCYHADINGYLSDMSNEDFKTGFMILVDKNLDRQINAKSYNNNNEFDNKQNLSEF